MVVSPRSASVSISPKDGGTLGAPLRPRARAPLDIGGVIRHLSRRRVDGGR